jgi:HlyD family secretion protein
VSRSDLPALATAGRRWAVRLVRRMTRRTRLVVASCGALLVLGFGWLALGHQDGPASDPIRVRREDLVLTVEIEGELAAVRSIDLGPPPMSPDLYWGQIKIAFLVPESTAAKRGQPLLGFDTQPLARALETKQAELAEATTKIEQKGTALNVRLLDLEQQLAQAEADLRKAGLKADVPAELVARIEAQKSALDLHLKEKTVASLKTEIESAKVAGDAERRLLESQRARAQARVVELQAAMVAMMVAAPQDGIVIYRPGWNDEKKKIGDSVSPAEKVLSLPDLSEMKGVGDIDEADAGRVAVNQRVSFRLEAKPDNDLAGRIVKIAGTVRRKSWRLPYNVYRVEIALDRTDPAIMRPAMRFRGEVETGRVNGILAVPREAVFLRGSGPAVWVKSPLGWTERRVALGRSNARLVEVVSGLAEGNLISPTDLNEEQARQPGRPGA